MDRARGYSEFFQSCRRFNQEILSTEIEYDFYEVLDKFASRYGWEENKILSLPASSFLGYYFAIKRAEKKEELNRLKAAAFTSWRIENLLNGIVSSIGNQDHKGTEFNDYLAGNHLLTREERKEWQAMKHLRKLIEQQETKKKQNMADIIMLADKKRQKSLQDTQERKGDT